MKQTSTFDALWTTVTVDDFELVILKVKPTGHRLYVIYKLNSAITLFG